MEAEVINAVVNSPNTIEILLRASGPLFGLLVLIGVFLIAHKYIPQLISSFNGLTSEVKLMRETLSNMSQRVDESEENAVTITKRLDAIEMTLKKINEDITEIRQSIYLIRFCIYKLYIISALSDLLCP